MNLNTKLFGILNYTLDSLLEVRKFLTIIKPQQIKHFTYNQHRNRKTFQ